MRAVIEGRQVLMRAGESVSDTKSRLHSVLEQVRPDEPFARELRGEILEWCELFDTIPSRFIERRRLAYEESARPAEVKPTAKKKEGKMSIRQRENESPAAAETRARRTLRVAEGMVSPLEEDQFLLRDVQEHLGRSADLDESNVEAFLRERRRWHADVLEAVNQTDGETCSELVEAFGKGAPNGD